MKFLLSSLFAITFLWGQALTFGVVPQQSPLIMAKKWNPLIEHLKQSTGLDIRFKTEKSIPEFEKHLYAGAYEIAYMNPYHYVVAHHKQNYEAAVRADKLIQGILLVNKEKGITEISQMKGKTFLFPAPFAFAATLVTKYELKSRFGIDADTGGKVLYVNSHDSVYKGVARGVGDVGGGIVRTFNNLNDQQSKEKLHIIYRTDQYPSHPIGYLPKMEQNVQKKITQALQNLPPDILKALSIKKMIQTNNEEYQMIKALAQELKIMPE